MTQRLKENIFIFFVVLFLAFWVCCGPAGAQTFTRNTIFYPHTKIIASEMNAEFDNIISGLNGNLEGSNITDGSILGADLASGTVTRVKLANLAQTTTNTTLAFSNTGTTTANVTNLSATVNASGVRPIWISLLPTTIFTANSGFIKVADTADSDAKAWLILHRDGTEIANWELAASRNAAGNGISLTIPATSIYFIDESATTGNHTYVFKTHGVGATDTMSVNYVKMIAFEL